MLIFEWTLTLLRLNYTGGHQDVEARDRWFLLGKESA